MTTMVVPFAPHTAWGRPFHFILLSGGGRISTVPTTNSLSEGIVGAPLAVALFCLHSVHDTNSSLNSSVGTPFYVALFHHCTMSDANSSIFDFFGDSSVLH
jgi:hypothetical protein